jgi:hypothetical protein
LIKKKYKMKVSTEKAYNKKKYACFSEEKKITGK